MRPASRLRATAAATGRSSASRRTTSTAQRPRAALAAASRRRVRAPARRAARTWAQRWDDADVVIDGDAELQHAVRFALFHLMALGRRPGRGGRRRARPHRRGYRGHVFWDSDVFVLPFLAATHPQAARAMLEYRSAASGRARRGTQQSAARARGSPGNPPRTAATSRRHGASSPQASVVPIRTGELEEHIVADVAWAASHYLDWTGDEAFAAGAGRQLLVETARYWASRVRFDRRRPRPHLRRDRPRRVPRARRRQRLHERDRALEPAARRRDRPVSTSASAATLARDRGRACRRLRPRRAGSTSSSRGSSSSSRS